MFNDRDLGLLGAGALAAVLCLFLPFSFAGKVVTGFVVLVVFMVGALLRLGPDRVPLETWLTRKARFAWGTRKFVNQREPSSLQTGPQPVPNTPTPTSPVPTDFRPVDLAWEDVGIYPLVTAFLAVVGLYFSFWLAQGGADQISIYFRW